MLHTPKLVVLPIAAAFVVLALLASIASATRTMTAAPARTISATPSGKLTFDAGGRQAICNMTMNGSMTAFAINIGGGIMGEIQEARVNECNSEVTFERPLVSFVSPWQIVSNRILGVLPESITGITFQINSVRLGFATFFGIFRCLYEGTMRLLSRTTRTGASRYSINSVTSEGISGFSFISGSEFCPSTGRLSGSMRFTSQTITFA